VYSGRGCEPEGGPDACVVTAHDAQTGEELWRTRTIPAPGEPGDETWGDVPFEERLHVGTWMVPSYDPELNLVYVGTSVTSPAPKFLLGGNDQSTCITTRRSRSTATPGASSGTTSTWSITGISIIRSSGCWWIRRSRPTRGGHVDQPAHVGPASGARPDRHPRQDRHRLHARPRDRESSSGRGRRSCRTSSGIDGATGAVTVNPGDRLHRVGTDALRLPEPTGGKNWPAGAYSPLTNTMYFPLQQTCMMAAAIGGEDSIEGRCTASRRARSCRRHTEQVGLVYRHPGHRRDAAEPGSGGLADVAADARRLGLQPARPDRRSNVASSSWSGRGTRWGQGQSGGDAARLSTASCTCRTAATTSRRFDARPASCFWEYQREFPEGVRRHEPQHRDLRHDDHQLELRQSIYALDARPASWSGKRRARADAARAASSGPIVANGKVITGRQCQPDAGTKPA
jgi:hypothetical protein